MSIFEYLNTGIMLILGIGVTQLLSDCVDAFRLRQSSRLHWLPLTWAGLVFAWQMQFLWAVFELQSLETKWTGGEFILMIHLALLLFVAGSLVVPKASDETPNALTQFQQDGRWTLLVLAVYFLLAFGANIVMFEVHFWQLGNLGNLLLSMVLLFTLFSDKEKHWTIGTMVFTLLSVVCIVLDSPRSYE